MINFFFLYFSFFFFQNMLGPVRNPLPPVIFKPPVSRRNSRHSGCAHLWLARCPGERRNMAIKVYTSGCRLLCHDDAIGSRKVSYILYLTDSDCTWREVLGFALGLYNTRPGQRDHEASIPPAFNQLSFFAIHQATILRCLEQFHAPSSCDWLLGDSASPQQTC